MSTEVELKLTADAASATREIAGFRKEYAGLVRSIEKPLRQIDVLQKTQESAKAASTEFFAAKRQVDSLKSAIAAAGQPVKALDQELVKAERTLTRTSRAFEVQKQRVKEQRAELRAAGVDTSNLVKEQKRLQADFSGALSKGRADSALQAASRNLGVTQLRELRANLISLRSDYDRLTRAGVLSATERAAAEMQYKRQLESTRQQIKEMSSGAGAPSEAGGVNALTARIASITATAYAVQRIGSIYFNAADGVGELEDRLRNVTRSEEEFTAVQETLREVSSRTYTQLAANTELFLGSVRPLQELGFATEDVTRLVGALSMGLVASGVKGERASSVIDQFNKAMQLGVLRGDAFNSVLQNAPDLTQALADGLQVTRAELVRMANAGELTSQRVIPALVSQYDVLGKKVDDIRVTVADAGVKMGDAFDHLISSLDNVINLSGRTAASLNKMADAINGLANNDAFLENLGKLSAEIAKLVPMLAVPLLAAEKSVEALGIKSEKAAEKVGDAQKKYALQQDLFEKEEVDRNIRRLAAAEKAAAERAGLRFDEAASLASWARAMGETYDNFIRREQERHRLLEAGERGHQKLQSQARESGLADLQVQIDKQLQVLEKAKGRLQKSRDDELAIEREFNQLIADVRSGGRASGGSFSDVNSAKAGAREALLRGDYKSAIEQARQAGEILKGLQQAGANDYGFTGIAQDIAKIATEAAKLERVNVETEVKGVESGLQDLQKQAEALKVVSIDVKWDQAGAEEVKAQMMKLAADLARVMIIKPTIVPPDGVAGSTTTQATQGFANGGWTGPGSKYQPAGLVHADEHVQPARVVNEPGALPFLEQIRRNGFQNTMRGLRGYAEGGLVAPPRLLPDIPVPSPELLARAQAPALGDYGTVNFQFPGAAPMQVLATPDTATELRRLALKFARTKS